MSQRIKSKGKPPVSEREELKSPGIDDGRGRPPLVDIAEPVAPAEPVAAKKKDPAAPVTANIVLQGQAARDPNAPIVRKTLRVSSAAFATIIRLPNAHHKGFASWCKLSGHGDERTVVEWRVLHDQYLKTPVK